MRATRRRPDRQTSVTSGQAQRRCRSSSLVRLELRRSFEARGCSNGNSESASASPPKGASLPGSPWLRLNACMVWPSSITSRKLDDRLTDSGSYSVDLRSHQVPWHAGCKCVRAQIFDRGGGGG